MEEGMLIGGYTIEELKKIQRAVQKDASKIVSDAIAKATAAMEEIFTLDITDSDDKSRVEGLAKLADEQLELAKVVASVGNVEYYLPFRTDYDDGDSFYVRFENEDSEVYSNDTVSDLMGTLEDMEYTSRQWHESRC